METNPDTTTSARPSETKIYLIDPKELKIKSDVRQPLKKLTRDDVQDLINSFRDRIERNLPPIRTPLEVTTHKSGEIVLITGRRRRRAALYMGLTEVPIIYADQQRKLTEEEELEHEISENSIRVNLNLLDEARAILKLIAVRAREINSYQNLIDSAPEGMSPEQVLVNFLKRIRNSLGNDQSQWRVESIRNPLFAMIADSMKKVGKEWYPYTERVLTFLSYRQPIQELFNVRLIGYESAKKLNKIRDDEILKAATAEIELKRRKSKSLSEKEAVNTAVANAFEASRALKRVGSVIRITERTDQEFSKIVPAADNLGWLYNSKMLRDELQPRRDVQDGMLWTITETAGDMIVPRSVYERILLQHSKVNQKVMIVGATNAEPLKIALQRGCVAKYFAPDATSEYATVSRLDHLISPLDSSKKSRYADASVDNLAPPQSTPGPKQSTPEVKKQQHARIGNNEADLGILVLHPYGEIDISNELNWENKNWEPTHMMISEDYYASVGKILAEMTRTCKTFAVITRYSEKKSKSGRNTEYIYTPSLVGYSLRQFITATYYYRAQGGKVWTVFMVKSP